MKLTPEQINGILTQLNSESEEINYICKKIIQAYRIRIKCMIKRRDLLENDHGLFSHKSTYKELLENPSFIPKLRAILDKEKKVLEIIRKDAEIVEGKVRKKQSQTNFEYASAKLKEYKKKYQAELAKKQEEKEILKFEKLQKFVLKKLFPRQITPKDMDKFLIHMIEFLEKNNNLIRIIEKRIEIEECFLQESNRNEKNFKAFIKAWELELEADKDVYSYYQHTLAANRKFVYSEIDQMYYKDGKFALALGRTALSSLTGGFIFGFGFINILFLINAVIAFALLLKTLDSIMKVSFTELWKDTKLVWKVEHSKA